MRFDVHPMHDSKFLGEPLSAHPFVDDPQDDYRCAECKKSRAMHDTRDGFTTTPYHHKKQFPKDKLLTTPTP